MKIQVVLKVEKQTKNTIRYRESSSSLGSGKVIGTLYVQKNAIKEAFEGTIPDELTVTIEGVE